MFATRKILFQLGVMVLFLAFATSANAQQGDNSGGAPLSPREPFGTNAGQHPPLQATNANPEWQSKLEERTERREFREEAQTIRAEHEDLEMERDRLKSQCMDAKGQERANCHEQWEALKQKQEALHVRIMNLHEKMQAERNLPPDADEPGEWRAEHTAGPQGSGPGGQGGITPVNHSLTQN